MEDGIDRDHYTVENFVLDDDFCRWVLHPDTVSDAFWTDWLARHPYQQKATEEAWKLIRLLNRVDGSPPLPLSEKKASFHRFLKKIDIKPATQ